MTEPYLPFYSERRCLVCGQWRGQHIGESANNKQMLCPLDPPGLKISRWLGVTASFVPGKARYELPISSWWPDNAAGTNP